jgi:hypothetical protein
MKCLKRKIKVGRNPSESTKHKHSSMNDLRVWCCLAGEIVDVRHLPNKKAPILSGRYVLLTNYDEF